MACPDEDTIAQLLQGLLPASELARLEQHIDGCTACAELVAELGKAYGQQATGPETWKSPSQRPLLGRVELFAGAIHLLITAKVVWLLIAWGQPVLPTSNALLVAALVAYASLCGPVGAALALLGAWGARRGSSWARRAVLTHALVALPSVVLTPLAIYVLVRQRAAGR